MTEQEAKTKWCPFVRIPKITINGDLPRGGYAWTSANLDQDIRSWPPNKCIGSDCMAWRGTFDFAPDGSLVHINDGSGYCGLAGKP